MKMEIRNIHSTDLDHLMSLSIRLSEAWSNNSLILMMTSRKELNSYEDQTWFWRDICMFMFRVIQYKQYHVDQISQFKANYLKIRNAKKMFKIKMINVRSMIICNLTTHVNLNWSLKTMIDLQIINFNMMEMPRF